MLNREQMRNYCKRRRARLKAAGWCVSCARVKAESGKVRCTVCLAKAAGWQKNYTQQIARSVRSFVPKTPEELYQMAKGERELVSWAWRNPA